MKHLGTWLIDLTISHHFLVYVDRDNRDAGVIHLPYGTWGPVSMLDHYRGRGSYQ